jgi:hypothetical protein
LFFIPNYRSCLHLLVPFWSRSQTGQCWKDAARAISYLTLWRSRIVLT